MLMNIVCFSQNSSDSLFSIKGNLIDENTGETLIGASILYAEGKGVVADIDGNFELKLSAGVYTLNFSFIGYENLIKVIQVNNAPLNLKTIKLSGNKVLDEVEINADVAKSRETPVAFSDVTAKQIREELGANDLPMLLNSTPGAYASQQGGGAGDSRVNIRGFDQRNVAVLVDGVPVNDMENGQVYWSNWQGLSEVTKKMQVQRGLGASKLALPSVGGVINIITNSIDQKQLFTFKNDMGTNNYHRYGLGYNSGIIKNKFGITLAASYTEGDGYVDQTWQKAWSYFLKLSYKINNRHYIVFGLNGAPQSHAQRSFAINMLYHDRNFAVKQGINADSVHASLTNQYTNAKTGARGITYSPDWGYINGKPFTAKVNFFHKPLFNLSYFANFTSRFSFSNVFYASFGNGGGTTLSSFSGGYDVAQTGQLYMQNYYNTNFAAKSYAIAGNLRPASTYVLASINQHKWLGSLSSFKYNLNDKLNFLVGLDARIYNGLHYQTPYNFLGADFIFAPAGRDLNLTPTFKDSVGAIRKLGDKINYHYESKITWLGSFVQAEYKSEKISAFVTITGNQNTYQNINYFGKRDIILENNNTVYNALGYGDSLYKNGNNYGVWNNGTKITRNSDGSVSFKDAISQESVTIPSNYIVYNNTSSNTRVNSSPIKILSGYTMKGGANYKVDRNHNVFSNIGYMNQVPKYSNVFDRSGIEIKNVKNQLIYSGEIGYSIKYPWMALNINGYLTTWKNKPLDFPKTASDPNSQNAAYYNVPGLDAKLKGIEMDMMVKPTKWLELKTFGMLADWRWDSKGLAFGVSADGTPLKDSVVFDARGVHMGNAPQRQLGGSARVNLFDGFYIKPQFTYFDKMYAQFEPSAFNLSQENKNGKVLAKDSWLMPGYGLLDLYVGYTIKQKKSTISIIALMNNVLNTVYMTDAQFASTINGVPIVPEQFNALNSYGWMGLGRRINIGIKFQF